MFDATYWLTGGDFCKTYFRYLGSFTNFFVNKMTQLFHNFFDLVELNLFSTSRYFYFRKKTRKTGKYFGKFVMNFCNFSLKQDYQDRFKHSFRLQFLKKYVNNHKLTKINLF